MNGPQIRTSWRFPNDSLLEKIKETHCHFLFSFDSLSKLKHLSFKEGIKLIENREIQRGNNYVNVTAINKAMNRGLLNLQPHNSVESANGAL